MILEEQKDPMGWAIADYYRNGVAGRLRVFSSMFDEDEMPVDELFRTLDDMPEVERTAIALARGKVLDVGAGSGCHSLALQEKGLIVTAVEISPRSVDVMKKRGVADARLINLYDKELAEKFDTILMLMNGTGIIGRLSNMTTFFARIDELLARHPETIKIFCNIMTIKV